MGTRSPRKPPPPGPGPGCPQRKTLHLAPWGMRWHPDPERKWPLLLLELERNLLAVPRRHSENGVIWAVGASPAAGDQTLPGPSVPRDRQTRVPWGQLCPGHSVQARRTYCRGGPSSGRKGDREWGRRGVERGGHGPPRTPLGLPHNSPVWRGLPGPEAGKRHKSGVRGRRVSSPKPAWEPWRAQTQAP